MQHFVGYSTTQLGNVFADLVFGQAEDPLFKRSLREQHSSPILIDGI